MITATVIPSATYGDAGRVSASPVRAVGTAQEQLRRPASRLVHHHEGGVLWIEGPADAGKSHALALAAEDAVMAGAMVLVGRGVDGGGMPPLAPLLDALAPVIDAGDSEPRTPYQTMRWVEDCLRELAGAQPLVVVLDDIQHYDEASLLAVRRLTTRLAGLPLLWLLASRTHPEAPAASSTRRHLLSERAEVLELTPFTPEAVRLMVRDLLGQRAEDAEPYLPLLGGLPGAVRHLCLLLASTSDPDRSIRAGRDLTAQAVVTRRLEQLTQGARDLVLILSALGDDVGVRHLCRMLDRDESALLRPLRELLGTGLVQPDGRRLTFAHPSVRDAVAATLPPSMSLSVRRRSLGIRLAEGTPASLLATEIGEVAEPGDERALHILETAAREVAPLEPAAAAAHLRRAMDLSRVPSRRARLAARLMPLLWETGETDEARALAGELLRTPPDAVTHARACLELTRTGSQFPVPHAEAHLCRALHHQDVPRSLKDQIRSTALLHRLLSGEGDEVGATDAGDMEAGDAGEGVQGTHPLHDLTQHTLRSMNACRRQRWTEALALSESVPAKTVELDPQHGPALPEVILSMAWRAALLGSTGAGRAAGELVEGSIADARKTGRVVYLPLWLTLRARLLLDGGRLADAARELAAVGAGPHPRYVSVANETATACTRARVALHTGDDAEIASCAALADRYLAGDDPRTRQTGAWIALLTAGYRNEVLRPLQLRAAATHLRRGYLHTTCVDAGDVVLLVAAALAAGEREVAAETVRFAEERARLNSGLPLFAAAAVHVRGLYTGNADLLTEAAARHGDTRPLLRARALEDAGERAAAEGTGDARSRFEEALRLYDKCGAEHDGRRVRTRLRRLGIHLLPTAGAPMAAAGTMTWRGLTRSELGVVRLVAHGATNREAAQQLFVSPHTVDTHLRHAFEKLGVRSRVQLARLYAREVDVKGACA
ncbi:LuxR C-terminal-related transcriptional regulator [Streptomyces sp. NPDC021140]|uniref:helix-turn-helix transcriptional regulator n=1 Tax=Streptomyces sp. NPDC021140 TaxID=3365116 RepID=UPI0037A8F49B